MVRIYWQAFLAQLTQFGIAFDQMVSTVLGFGSLLLAGITMRAPPAPHMADETISAMLHRKYTERKPWGYLAPFVDVLFALWQRDERGDIVWNHCERAYEKERQRKNLPGEYAKT